MSQIFTGRTEELDTVQHLLGNAKVDWIKNDKVRAKIQKAIKCVVEAREAAIAETLRSQNIQVKIR